jgi:hypothetical protein
MVFSFFRPLFSLKSKPLEKSYQISSKYFFDKIRGVETSRGKGSRPSCRGNETRPEEGEDEDG